MVEKAVILAAGSASRMQQDLEKYVRDREELAVIRTGEKMAARFGKIPFLDYQILNLIKAGVTEINIVLKPEERFFKNHYNKSGRKLFPEASISFSFQKVPEGTAHAVLAARDFVAGSRFIVLNGDNNYPAGSIRMLLEAPEEPGAMVAFDVEGFNEETRKRVKSFALIRTRNGKLVDIIEKPDDPGGYRTNDILFSDDNKRVKVEKRLLASMNLWCFDRDIIEACRDVPRHEPRKQGKAGEYELTDAVKLMIERGREMLVYYIYADVLDLTKAEDIDVVGKRIKEDLRDRIEELESRYSRL
jgi:dTDP-glucose pyrophosphorylase